MPVPATSGVQRSNVFDMEIGDYIACEYRSASGLIGTFGNLGKSITNEIPISGSASPNGGFYLIKANRGLLISDRVIQYNMPWDKLNNFGYIEEGLNSKDGLQLNGTTSHVQIPYTSSLAPPLITLMVEVSVPTWRPSGRMDFICKEFGGGYTIALTDLGNIFFNAYANGAYRQVVFNYTEQNLQPNRKYTIVGTYDGRYSRLYVDGKLAKQTDSTTTFNMTYSVNNSLFLGCKSGDATIPNATPYYLRGTMYKAAVLNRAAAASEIASGINSTTAGVVGFWDFSYEANSSSLFKDFQAGNGVVNDCISAFDSRFKVRSSTGGVAYADENGYSSLLQLGMSYGAFPANNEWDTYIKRSDLGGKITPDDDNVWHHKSIFTMCQETPLLANFTSWNGSKATPTNVNRVIRGNESATSNFKEFSFIGPSDPQSSWGFRPVFEYREAK